MQATAVVINAGIGDLSMGLEMAGFKVVAAYEPDEKAVLIHHTNIDAPIYRLSPEEIDIDSLPEFDLLAARIYCSLNSHNISYMPIADADMPLYNLFNILTKCRPRSFFLLLNANSVKSKEFQRILEKIYQANYQFAYHIIDSVRATGLPVKEHMVCIVGTLQGSGNPFKFPEYKYSNHVSTNQFLELKQPVNPWYFNINPNDLPQYEDGKQFYCWKNSAYVSTDLVQWNSWKVPLVSTGEAIRKITHREIANLKGFPVYYSLPEKANRQWLYKKLMYAFNVLVIKQIADMINYVLTDNPWRDQQLERELQLE